MEELLEDLKEALEENPDLILEGSMQVQRMSTKELKTLFEDDKSENNHETDDLD